MLEASEFESAFTPSHGGAFMSRDGLARASGTGVCQKKLCIVATDFGFLRALLFDLSGRDDCYFVKYSLAPRDGMYLGRCFLTDEGAVGRLWQELKVHPKLMCSIQDDEFTLAFRELG